MNIHDGDFRLDGLVFLDEAQARALDHVILAKGDVLLNITGASVARVCRLPPRYAGGRVNQHVAIIRPRLDKLHPDYLAQCLISPSIKHALLNVAGAGATREAITKKQLQEFEIPLPPLDEQRRIAAILDQTDDLRRKRRKALRRLDSMLAVQFLDLFGDPEVNPKGFAKRHVDELLAESPNFGSMIPPSETRGEWLSLRVANIQDWELDLADSKYINLPPKDLARHTLRDGDLILARAIASEEHLGKCVVVNPSSAKWAFDSHLVRIRLNGGKANPIFVRDLFRSAGGRRIFLRSTRRTTVQYNINTKEIRAMIIPVPSIEMQATYVEIVAAIDALKFNHRAHLAKLDALFASSRRAGRPGGRRGNTARKRCRELRQHERRI
jgi:type I restriction enzyme S subunit